MFELKQSTSNVIIMVPSLRNVDPLQGLKAFKLKLDLSCSGSHISNTLRPFQYLCQGSNMSCPGLNICMHVQGQIIIMSSSWTHIMSRVT